MHPNYSRHRGKLVSQSDETIKLVLLRHGQSEWNRLNLFTGWTDVDLSDQGREEAKAAGIVMKEAGFDFDICYTSYLKRAIHTLNLALESMDREWLPVVKTWRLNERHYGALQGLNKSETAAKFGESQVKIWRRSYDVCPPALNENDERNAALQDPYRNVDKADIPLTESLEVTVQRVKPYFDEVIKPRMLAGDRVLIAAHGNSLRALVMMFENLGPGDIVGVNIPTGVPLVYEFDQDMKFLSKRYLGDQEDIQSKMKAVADQGKKS
jgi:2,3-bisphosphoglycerate-dependent phosphoglycerate mutase